MISKLHYITDSPELAEKACKAGCRWIQLRVKDKPLEEWKKLAGQFKKICVNYNTILIINDNPKIAIEVLAEGVHLGKEDLPIEEARNMLGNNYLIGATANTFDEILHHTSKNVDYIGLGPFRYTSTKKNLSPILGLQGYERIMKQCKIHQINVPVIAIGGITEHDVEALLNTGVYGIALSSAISNASMPEIQTKIFLEKINNFCKQLQNTTRFQ